MILLQLKNKTGSKDLDEEENKWVPIVAKSRSIRLSRKGITGRYSLLNRVSKNKATIEFSMQIQFNDWLLFFIFYL